MPAEFKRDDFAKHENTEFVLEQGTEEETVLRLTEVTEEQITPQHSQFSLVFEGPAEMLPEPRIYRITHPELGEFDLFLSPFAVNETGLKLEASFSMLT
ncbi:MAG: hypothetical protein OEM82_14050 [Acidobacteriota bacterium]|nr:hypothetical protein [Acidobacteriota bacterium]MDH3531241.1 hypothetical protein [Acidobacteriota bacterium]